MIFPHFSESIDIPAELFVELSELSALSARWRDDVSSYWTLKLILHFFSLWLLLVTRKVSCNKGSDEGDYHPNDQEGFQIGQYD